MIWARRRLGWMGYVPYHERITELHRMARTPHEFMMVARRLSNDTELEVFIALPDADLLRAFDGFELIPEDLLPMEIDMLLFADRSAREFTRRFSFRNQRARTEKGKSVQDRPRS